MCGICGLTFDGPDAGSAGRLLEAMLGSQEHRGPDGQGTLLAPGVALGHRRLAIIDLECGAQPMRSPEGAAVTFNGEIYNYREMRARLEAGGRRFATTSDTEVLLAAYLEKPDDFLSDMVGMFAFAIHDPSRNRILLARDRLGKKPLYYWLGRQGLAFASEMKALLALPQVRHSLEIDPEALRDYLSLGYILEPKSIFSTIRKLPPGCTASYDLGERSLCVRRWWDVRDAFLAPKHPWNGDAVERFDELLTDSVRLRLRSDVPVGVFLSGGLDSSAVTACLGEAGTDVRLFCVRFGQDSFDESPHARKVAGHLGLELTCVDQGMPDMSDLSRLVWHFDEPFCDTSMVPMFQVSRAARGMATVILGGDGADELLAGYVTHRANRLRSMVGMLPKPVLGGLRGLARAVLKPSYRKLSFDYKLLKFLEGASLPAGRAHSFWRTIFSDAEVGALLDPDFSAALNAYTPARFFDQAFEDASGMGFLDSTLYVDMQTWLAGDILVKCDRMSMANSLELRSPFLDHRLVEFCAALPGQAKMDGFEQKVVLRRAMAGRLPASILGRAKKGFNFPAFEISSRHLEPPRASGVFRRGFRLDPAAEDVTYKSFSLLVLSLWFDIFENYKATGRWEPLPY